MFVRDALYRNATNDVQCTSERHICLLSSVITVTSLDAFEVFRVDVTNQKSIVIDFERLKTRTLIADVGRPHGSLERKWKTDF